MRTPAPCMMMVFRNIGEDGEVAEGAYDPVDLPFGQIREYPFKLRLRVLVVIPVKANGKLTDGLDQIVGFSTFERKDRLAQNPPQQTDIVAECLVHRLKTVFLCKRNIHNTLKPYPHA